LVEALREHTNRLESGRLMPKHPTPNYDLFFGVGSVVRDWCWEAPYTSPPDADPRALRLDKGEDSLGGLIRRRIPGCNVNDVVTWMLANRVIVRQRDGTYVLTQRSVVIADSELILAERFSTLAAQYLETAMNNLRLKDRHHRNVDREARVFHLPEALVPEFREMVESQTQSFLESIDMWLESHDEPSATRGTIEAGVHSYAYTAPAERNHSRR
jgi:hypothetical protein